MLSLLRLTFFFVQGSPVRGGGGGGGGSMHPVLIPTGSALSRERSAVGVGS